MTRPLRAAACAAMLAVPVMGLSACSSSTDLGDPQTLLRLACEQTARIPDNGFDMKDMRMVSRVSVAGAMATNAAFIDRSLAPKADKIGRLSSISATLDATSARARTVIKEAKSACD